MSILTAKVFSLLFVAFALFSTAASGGSYSRSLPANQNAALKEISFSQAVYDANHKLLHLTLSRDEKYRLYTPLTQIAPAAIALTLLQEDQYFYWHLGVNPLAIVKAAWKTYLLHSRRIGASTISMQVARLLFHINSKTWRGKLWQMARALQLELCCSKEQLLTAYLNLAPYGNNIEGIGAASMIYFAKPASNLTLAEALALVVMPQNPLHHLLPAQSKRSFAQRQDGSGQTRYLLARRALWRRWIEKHPENRAQNIFIDLPLPTKAFVKMPFFAPHFVTALIAASSRQSSPELIATLDLDAERIAERVVHDYLARQQKFGVSNAAVLLVDTRDMAVKALLGSGDFWQRAISGQINGAAIKRSPGSTLKPLIYALALDQGVIHPATMLKDVPTSFGAYNPENFDNDFMGPLSAERALTLSRNIPALYLASKITNPNLYQLLQRAEVSDMHPESFYGLSLALGGLEVSMQELVGMYAALANGGVWRPLRMRQDEPLFVGKQLFSPEAAFLVLDMLKNTVRPLGFEKLTIDNRRASVTPLRVAWKTGTSSGYRDAWTVGVFGHYVLAVWLGDFAGRSNPALIGKSMAAPLFFALVNALTLREPQMVDSLATLDAQHLHIVPVEVCAATGMLPTRYCPERKLTWFIPGKSPIKRDDVYREVALERKSGLRTCRFDGDVDFVVYEFWSTDLLNLWQRAGIKRRVPPPFVAGCGEGAGARGRQQHAVDMGNVNAGMVPQITAPQAGVEYVVRVGDALSANNNQIPLAATVDGDVKRLYWFVDHTYIGSTAPQQTLWWQGRAGKFTVRVIDDHGRTAAEELTVIALTMR